MSRWLQMGLAFLLLLAIAAAGVALALPLVRDGGQFGIRPGPAWTPPGGVGTARPVVTPQPSPQGLPELTADVIAGPLNLRSAPGTGSQVLARGQSGQQFQVVGRNADGSWLKLCCINGQTVWAAAQYLQLNGPVDRAPITDR